MRMPHQTQLRAQEALGDTSPHQTVSGKCWNRHLLLRAFAQCPWQTPHSSSLWPPTHGTDVGLRAKCELGDEPSCGHHPGPSPTCPLNDLPCDVPISRHCP